MIGAGSERTFRLKDDSVVKIMCETEQGDFGAAYPKRVEVANNGSEIAYLAGKSVLIIVGPDGQSSASSITWTIYEFEQTKEGRRILWKIVMALIKSLRGPESDAGAERGGGAPLLAVTMPTIPPMSRDEPPRRRPPDAKF